MGFFRNKANDDAIKKAESELLRDDEPKVKESAPLPSLEEVQRDARRKELDAISGEIEQKRREVTSLEEIVSTKQQLRISIEEKLSDVRLEYDNAVGNLMSTKKELNEKRRDIRSASAELENVQKRLTDIIADTASAETIRKKKDDELKSTEKQHVVVKSQIAEMERAKNLLEEIKGEITSNQEKNILIKSQITKSDKVLQKLEEEKKHALKTISNAEKSLKRPPATKTVGENLVPPSESKSVVEAASAVVASMSQKLRSAENELAVIKGLLQKERHAHGVTLEKLSKFERS